MTGRSINLLNFRSDISPPPPLLNFIRVRSPKFGLDFRPTFEAKKCLKFEIIMGAPMIDLSTNLVYFRKLNSNDSIQQNRNKNRPSHIQHIMYRHFSGVFQDVWLRNTSSLLEMPQTQIPPTSSDCGWIQKYRNVSFSSKPPGASSSLIPRWSRVCHRLVYASSYYYDVRPTMLSPVVTHASKCTQLGHPLPTPSVFNIRVHSFHVIWSADAQIFQHSSPLTWLNFHANVTHDAPVQRPNCTHSYSL